MGEDLPVLRLSDAEREDIVAVLRLHTGEGRLTLDEFAERAERVYGAQTKSDLEPLVRDLPSHDLAITAPGSARPVEQRPVGIEGLGDGGFEQPFLALEVVVERAHADVRGLGDLEYRDGDLALGDEGLRRRDQGRAGALLAPLQSVDGRG